MKKEIKFRCWNRVTQAMVDLKKITRFALTDNFSQDGLFIPFGEDFILMQYTGLKDKNGKAIYEGDIVKYCNGTWEVRWITDCWHLVDQNNNLFDNGLSYEDWDDTIVWNDTKIIGNIYEKR